MRIKLVNIVSLISIITIISCEEKYWPDLGGKYESLLVVDGMISNEPGPYIISLSLSAPVGSDISEYLPASGYRVKIKDDHGNEESLIELTPGIFTTSSNGIQGVIGREYMLEITSPSGEIYQSDYELLRQATGIESVYNKLEYRQNENLPYDIAGYQFYLNTATAPQDSSYYLWDLTATYKYQADLKIRYVYDGTLRPFYNSDSLRICYKTQIIKEIFTYTTAGLATPVLTNFPLNYVTTETKELSFRYSLQVKQLSISEGAYKFWFTVWEQNSNAGDLYSRQPYQIKGNVFNKDKPNESVLGYFTVAGVSEKRIFVNRPMPPVRMRYPVCVVGEGDVENFANIFYSTENQWPLYATFDQNNRAALPNQSCMNCELSGGIIQKPEFWVDE
jgi:hypothetical protein